ncbi:hypothetical protein C7I84_21610 [Mesorhizobium ephedrae]|uniref:Uncharacterized protein n=1 Tax=Kumtagia ephedrae TaxID=2116701 RepID=A0A2P7S147_9HYPH|nr:hypothetical protein C7I84_21610 [Mesorhizobium ephedrae]
MRGPGYQSRVGYRLVQSRGVIDDPIHLIRSEFLLFRMPSHCVFQFEKRPTRKIILDSLPPSKEIAVDGNGGIAVDIAGR